VKSRSHGPEVGGEVGGFAVVDEKGRLSLPKPVRAQLGLEAGAAVAWIAAGGAVVIVPQDAHLADLSSRANQLLAAAGVSVDDVLGSLPEVRARVVEETYGVDFAAELAQAERDLAPDGQSSGDDPRR
jgi:AbrB family looped-hinge helix DNA binding protein